MSLPAQIAINSTVDIPVTFQGNPKVETEIHRLISRVLTLAVNETIVFMKEIVPESEAALFRYPTSYVSEHLLLTAVTLLEERLLALKRQGFQTNYTLPIEFPATYAKYVAAHKTNKVWPPVGWSKATSRTNFDQLTIEFFRQSYCRHMKKYLQMKAVIDRGYNKWINP